MTARKRWRITAVVALASLALAGSVSAAPVLLSTVPAYGFNVSPAPDGQPGIIGCGPTSGAMIFGTYVTLSSPVATARAMGASQYMDTDAGGFGSPTDFHFGLEDYAYDQGYLLDAVLHVEPTTFVAGNWPDYTIGADMALDAAFWNTTTWDINDSAFLAFMAAEIDQGRPLVVTVDSNSDGYNDHWMVGVGYDIAANKWAGFNTWDSGTHWYDVQSGFLAGNTMGIAFVRTFQFNGPITQPPQGPEPGTAALILASLLGLAVRRARAS